MRNLDFCTLRLSDPYFLSGETSGRKKESHTDECRGKAEGLTDRPPDTNWKESQRLGGKPPERSKKPPDGQGAEEPGKDPSEDRDPKGTCTKATRFLSAQSAAKGQAFPFLYLKIIHVTMMLSWQQLASWRRRDKCKLRRLLHGKKPESPQRGHWAGRVKSRNQAARPNMARSTFLD